MKITLADIEAAQRIIAGHVLKTPLLPAPPLSALTRADVKSDADALRFLIKANRDGIVEVAWSSERNHHPVAVGILAVDCNSGAIESTPLERQARAYAMAYVRRTGN